MHWQMNGHRIARIWQMINFALAHCKLNCRNQKRERKKSFLTITRNCANSMWMIFLHFDCILSQTQCNTHAHIRCYHTLSLPSPPNTNASEYCRVGTHTQTVSIVTEVVMTHANCSIICHKMWAHTVQCTWWWRRHFLCAVQCRRLRARECVYRCWAIYETCDSFYFLLRTCVRSPIHLYNNIVRHTEQHGTKLFLTDHVTFAMATSANMILVKLWWEDCMKCEKVFPGNLRQLQSMDVSIFRIAFWIRMPRKGESNRLNCEKTNQVTELETHMTDFLTRESY